MMMPRVARALVHLDSRRRQVCDVLGGRGRIAWSGEDAEAVRILIEEVRRLHREAVRRDY